MHAAALAWVPPGFAAFDTGRVDDEADDAVTVGPEQGANASGPEPVAGAEAAGTASNAEGDGNGHAAPEPGPAAADDGADAEPADAPPPADASGAAGAVPPPHINGRDAGSGSAGNPRVPAPGPLTALQNLRNAPPGISPRLTGRGRPGGAFPFPTPLTEVHA